MTDWPAWVTENVEVRPPDVAWQERGDRERLLLEATLGAWIVAPREHVGSAAVPNLSAKPILDLRPAVTNLDCAADIATALAGRDHRGRDQRDGHHPAAKSYLTVYRGGTGPARPT